MSAVPAAAALGGMPAPPAAQRVLEELREMIIKGDLAPGARIVERTLCAQLNVSRTPLREALKLLEIDGLVELSQNRGARVRAFTPAEALELFEVLAGLEGLAAELATARMSDEEMAHVRHLHGAMRTYFTQGRRDAYFELNSLIHEAVLAGAKNPTLASAHHALMLRAKRGRYLAIIDAERWHQAMEEHEALIAAFAERDAAAAGRIWRVHLVHTGETLAEVLRKSGL